jgi:hypothetical protein
MRYSRGLSNGVIIVRDMNVDAVPVETSRIVGDDGSAIGSSGGGGMIVAA